MKNRKRNRLNGYDYSSDNLYFVTIGVKGRLCCFGYVVGTGRDLSVPNLSVREIVAHNQIMQLNAYGLIVEERLRWLEAHYPYIILHNFVVMPNHLHAIIEIDRSKATDFTTKIKSLSEVIGAFKTTSSKMIHTIGFLNFAWHRSFHDHIIRTEQSYLNITNYIDDNPNRWLKDTFFEKN